jgi:hypothetical protein
MAVRQVLPNSSRPRGVALHALGFTAFNGRSGRFHGPIRTGLAKMTGAMVMSADAFHEACAVLRDVLNGEARNAIVAEVSRAKSFDRAVRRLRDGMRAHRFDAHEDSIPSLRFVKAFDQRTRQDGFHVLHDWDGKQDRFNADIIPVEVATIVERLARPTGETERRIALRVLLDYYFLYLVALVAMRAWDEGDPNTNLEAAGELLGALQGPRGSGHRFVDRIETLLLVATSHFEPDVTAYETLLAKVRTLNRAHRVDLAIVHAAILGCHLRFGLEVTCGGNRAALREDNAPDYPWLCEALATLLEAYADEGDAATRARLSESILLGLMPDPEAFLGSRPPATLSNHAERRTGVRELFDAHRTALLLDFQAHRPAGRVYSPLAFSFNFPHNLVKGAAVDAALRGTPWAVGLDDLVTARDRREDSGASQVALATTLMRYALASPDTIRGKPHPAIVYHPEAGARAFEKAFDRLARLPEA